MLGGRPLPWVNVTLTYKLQFEALTNGYEVSFFESVFSLLTPFVGCDIMAVGSSAVDAG